MAERERRQVGAKVTVVRDVKNTFGVVLIAAGERLTCLYFEGPEDARMATVRRDDGMEIRNVPTRLLIWE